MQKASFFLERLNQRIATVRSVHVGKREQLAKIIEGFLGRPITIQQSFVRNNVLFLPLSPTERSFFNTKKHLCLEKIKKNNLNIVDIK
jgi:hypothetical protein